MMSTILFYMFSAVLLLSAVMVIAAKNPVHSVLFLVLAFFNAAGLFLLLGAEFLAFLLVIVYVGAVAVLFLFVVMMLDINFADLRKGATKALPVGIAVGTVLIAQLAMTMAAWKGLPTAGANILSPVAALAAKTNTHALGQVIYTDYLYPFQVSGLILLVAMVGAIALTLRERKGTLRQDINRQITRKRADVLKVVKVETGKGIG